MHSSHLRGSDFTIKENGNLIEHADFFADFSITKRLGIVTPNGVAGVGAATLIMAYMTAFYDRYRALGEPFRAYPDFYTFQSHDMLASYTMLDIWPSHKDVAVPDSASVRLDMIVDRAINILLVPEDVRIAAQVDETTLPQLRAKDSVLLLGEQGVVEYFKPQLESARRTVVTCFAYSEFGILSGSNRKLQIACPTRLLHDWLMTIFDTPTLAGNKRVQQKKAAWLNQQANQPLLTQTFRRIPFADALLRL